MVPKPPKLPPMEVLRVKDPVVNKGTDPCIVAMSSVLACWASVGYNAAGCAAVEATLRQCVDSRVPQKERKSSINYHLGRFQRRLEGRIYHKGSKD
ncbi:37S ribosomal protein Mrp10, mitochondrial [Sporothrix brasiliensis 5110]|uniref:37S ribosomal protein Mrp10, mitochondrial n=1 Tax=Sporothrix brasiliensis 5110 TaxID=1398154 RepID=A0A0C2JBL2_9PEZI|nr:37S ribosomal protein Mrp10, mitochondrial [Sporothrix brasiliensis 5110]KIH94262.1 37S ribosomal protein Mrp10, mitochondrial [Sporothrix brasiliensis 5110]